MLTYKFLENENDVVDNFYKKNNLVGPKLYLIAVGTFEDDELVELFTVSKPPTDSKKYTFVVNSCQASKHLPEMIKYFHFMYDGKIEGLE